MKCGTKLLMVSVIVFASVTVACGEDCVHGVMLCGDYDPLDARVVTLVTRAFQAVGIEEPCYCVIFVYSPDAMFRGKRWADFRVPDTPARNPDEGYRGFCDRDFLAVYVRRYGEAAPHCLSLLIHELLHAVGYDHGPAMKATEDRVWTYLDTLAWD